jgi:hypothetical protein
MTMTMTTTMTAATTATTTTRATGMAASAAEGVTAQRAGYGGEPDTASPGATRPLARTDTSKIQNVSARRSEGGEAAGEEAGRASSGGKAGLAQSEGGEGAGAAGTGGEETPAPAREAGAMTTGATATARSERAARRNERAGPDGARQTGPEGPGASGLAAAAGVASTSTAAQGSELPGATETTDVGASTRAAAQRSETAVAVVSKRKSERRPKEAQRQFARVHEQSDNSAAPMPAARHAPRGGEPTTREASLDYARRALEGRDDAAPDVARGMEKGYARVAGASADSGAARAPTREALHAEFLLAGAAPGRVRERRESEERSGRMETEEQGTLEASTTTTATTATTTTTRSKIRAEESALNIEGVT